MDGYVMNVSHSWTHAMKRAVGPGAKIELDELYSQYGVKYGLPEGQQFINWLRDVKLKDKDKWKIVFNDGNNDKVDVYTEPEALEPVKSQPSELVTPLVKTKLEIADVVAFSVREARDRLAKINDLTLLKYTLQEANQLAGKDSLCRLIRKRIKELQVAR